MSESVTVPALPFALSPSRDSLWRVDLGCWHGGCDGSATQ